MMFASKTYIPCLRWKMGEYQAVSKLSSSTRSSILPIIEVSEFGVDFGYDYETKSRPDSLDNHLSTFTSRVKSKWGTSECFIDLRYIQESTKLGDGSDPSDFVFSDLKVKGIQFTPIIRFHENSQFESIIHRFVNKERRGLCLRVNLDEFSLDDFENDAEVLLQNHGLSFSDCDLLLDLEVIKYEKMNEFAEFLTTILGRKNRLKSWITFGIIGTSFPQTLTGVRQGISFLPRNEWILYKLLINRLHKMDIRIPSFGDYTINNPNLSKINMRIVKPKANIRYTINDKWLIVRGLNVRDYKFSQFQQLCQSIINSEHFSGKNFSYGDDYIYRCSTGTATTGNLSTWRKVGTNHHIEMLVQDLAKLSVS